MLLLITSEQLARARDYVKPLFANNDPSHDWIHVLRVCGLATWIGMAERDLEVNPNLVLLLALLHDVGDHKYLREGENTDDLLRRACTEIGLDEEVTKIVAQEVPRISYSYEVATGEKPLTKEGKIVQDADRLDALGVIGKIRCYSFGAIKNRPIYTVGRQFSLKDYYKGRRLTDQQSSTDHIYVKLLDLAPRMNTMTGKVEGRLRENTMKVMLEALDREREQAMTCVPSFLKE